MRSRWKVNCIFSPFLFNYFFLAKPETDVSNGLVVKFSDQILRKYTRFGRALNRFFVYRGNRFDSMGITKGTVGFRFGDFMYSKKFSPIHSGTGFVLARPVRNFKKKLKGFSGQRVLLTAKKAGAIKQKKKSSKTARSSLNAKRKGNKQQR